MSSSSIIDASDLNPVFGSFRPVATRSRSNSYDIWNEHLCIRTDRPALATCVFGALEEPPEDWFDDEGEPIAARTFDNKLVAPAFHNGSPVSELTSFICGPLMVSPDGDQVELERWQKGDVTRALNDLGWDQDENLIFNILGFARRPPWTSALPDPLVANYVDTDYRAETSIGPISLNIGNQCADCAKLFDLKGVATAIYVTAWNPLSDAVDVTANRARNRLLAQDLEQVCSAVFEGEGEGRDKAWPAEESFLGLGLTFEQAVHLGRFYRQNAIVWVEADAVPRLVLLR